MRPKPQKGVAANTVCPLPSRQLTAAIANRYHEAQGPTDWAPQPRYAPSLKSKYRPGAYLSSLLLHAVREISSGLSSLHAAFLLQGSVFVGHPAACTRKCTHHSLFKAPNYCSLVPATVESIYKHAHANSHAAANPTEQCQKHSPDAVREISCGL